MKYYSDLSMRTSLKSSMLVEYLRKVFDQRLKCWIVWPIRSPLAQADCSWSTSRHWIKKMFRVLRASFRFCWLFFSSYSIMFDLLVAMISELTHLRSQSISLFTFQAWWFTNRHLKSSLERKSPQYLLFYGIIVFSLQQDLILYGLLLDFHYLIR